MDTPPTSKEIIPFSPRSFPPRHLRRKAFSGILLKANRALKEYNQALSNIPFPFSLLSTLIILEAMDSLDSQKINASLKDLLREKIAPSKKEDKLVPIIHYAQTLSWASKNISKIPISNKLICSLHKKIKDGTAPSSEIGVYRKRQNWIGPSGCKIDEAYFYPPAQNQVYRLMQELLHYCNAKGKEPLLSLALVFSQLLIIHPFMDGNGRVARILTPLFLFRKKVISKPFFFMSSYFSRHRLRYFQNLYKTTEDNQWEAWIVFFMKGVIIESKKARRLFIKIEDLYKKISEIKMNPRTLHFLFQQPVFLFSSFKKAGGSQQLLASLQYLKWVRKDKEGFYNFSPLLKILQSAKKH